MSDDCLFRGSYPNVPCEGEIIRVSFGRPSNPNPWLTYCERHSELKAASEEERRTRMMVERPDEYRRWLDSLMERAKPCDNPRCPCKTPIPAASEIS